jgi:hypothetical protein
MTYSDVKVAVDWLRLYAEMLESGKAELEANRLEMTTDAIDMTTCDEMQRVFIPGESHHTLTIKVRCG